MTEFVDILNNMRLGNLSNDAVQKFRQLSREVKYPDSLRPTELWVGSAEIHCSNLLIIMACQLSDSERG